MKLPGNCIRRVLTASVVAAGLAAAPSPAIANAPSCPALSPVLHGAPPLANPTTVAFRNYVGHAPVQCVA
jgi:hypothetical protein